jgi:2-desacetyl-2-hydroxyethyl bacteriochlorophyllide A dehydrogenase
MTKMASNPTVIFTAPRQAGVRDEPIREPGVGEVLVQTVCSGISAGTELNVYRGVAPQWRRRQDRESHLFVADDPEWTYPLVYGYANVGIVRATGPGVREELIGESVFSYQPHRAWNVVREPDLIQLPPLPDVRRGVFLANLTTALNGVLDAHPNLGDVVVVSGLGVIGLLVTRLLNRAGAGLVIGVDQIGMRRELAAEAGAGLVLEPSDALPEIVLEHTDGRGADIVIDASGAAPALGAAIRAVGVDGLVVALSWYGDAIEALELGAEFHHNRVRIRSSQGDHVSPELGRLWSLERRNALSVNLLAELPLERYITHEFAPEHASEAYARLDRREPDVLQCVFTFAEGAGAASPRSRGTAGEHEHA